jgi:hypothetical protein
MYRYVIFSFAVILFCGVITASDSEIKDVQLGAIHIDSVVSLEQCMSAAVISGKRMGAVGFDYHVMDDTYLLGLDKGITIIVLCKPEKESIFISAGSTNSTLLERLFSDYVDDFKGLL